LPLAARQDLILDTEDALHGLLDPGGASLLHDLG
jgi:hypothetical protein